MFLILAVFVLSQNVLGKSLTTGSDYYTNRVVNGKNALYGQFPYQVALVGPRGHTCGGSIITSYHILTAAHCNGFTSVRVGTTSLLFDPKIYYNVSKIHVIPTKHSLSIVHDVAIVEVETPIEFNNAVQPISIETNYVGGGAPGLALGFGQLKEWGPFADILQYLEMKTLENQECQAAYKFYSITDGMICARGNKREEDLCYGDSGGPLVVDGRVVGVASLVRNPCTGEYPVIFTRVSFYAEWIRNITNSMSLL